MGGGRINPKFESRDAEVAMVVHGNSEKHLPTGHLALGSGRSECVPEKVWVWGH
jgi:hypothetical protein